jgi:hypothetical protein
VNPLYKLLDVKAILFVAKVAFENVVPAQYDSPLVVHVGVVPYTSEYEMQVWHRIVFTGWARAEFVTLSSSTSKYVYNGSVFKTIT